MRPNFHLWWGTLTFSSPWAGTAGLTLASVQWYRENVKNITVSVPDEVYRRARIKAAEQSRSVSALVREFLIRLSEEESEFERRERLQRDVIDSIRAFRAGDRLSREKLHDRNAVR